MAPLNQMTLNAQEKDEAVLEIIKIHQLVVTQDFTESPTKLQPKDASDENTIENVTPCTISVPDEALTNEQWLNAITTSYIAQKATATIRSKIAKVEAFSNYLVSPMRKGYKVFHGTIMVCFRAIQCWLQLEPSGEAPRGWGDKRRRIVENLDSKFDCIDTASSIVKIPKDAPTLLTITKPHVAMRERLKVHKRRPNIKEVIRYDPLEMKNQEGRLREWTAYPGMANIIKEARDIIRTNQITWIEELINLMKGHESRQSTPLVASIAILISHVIKTK